MILSHGGGQSAIQWTHFEKHIEFKLPPCGNMKVFLLKFNSEFSGDSSEKLEVKQFTLKCSQMNLLKVIISTCIVS